MLLMETTSTAESPPRMRFVSELHRYGLAVISCVLALSAAWILDAPSSCFFLAVMVSTMHGGKGPGLVAVALSALAFNYFFLPPLFHFSLSSGPTTMLRFMAFLGAALLVLTLIETKRRTEEARIQLDAQFRAIADTAPDAIIWLGADTEILFVNPAGTNIFGWTQEELAGQRFNFLVPKFRLEDRQTVAEWVGRRKDGTTFAAEVLFGEIAGGRRHTFTGFVRDISDRKRTERALQRSESYLAEAQKLSRTGSFGWNTSTGECVWSAETCRIVNLDPKVKPSLQLLFELIHPDDVERVGAILERAVRTGEDLDFEHRFLLAESAVKFVHVISHSVKNDAGDLEYVGAITDITERQRSDEALRRSEAYLAEAQTLSHTGSWARNVKEFRSTYWSAEMFRIMGFPKQDAPPSTEAVRQRFAPGDWVRFTHMFETARQWKSSFDEIFPILLPDGSRRILRVVGNTVVNDDGEVVEFVGTSIDVTEQYQAREALEHAFDEIKKSEVQLRAIIDTIPTLAWSTGPDGYAEFFNRRWLDYTGLSTDLVLDRGWLAAAHPDDLECLDSYWASLLESGGPAEVEARLRRSDGEYRWFLFRASPLRDGTGRVVKWYGTNTDIEDRRRAEEAVRASEHNFRLIVDSIPGFVWTDTPEGEIELVNQPLQNYTGKTLEELRNWPSILHPADRAPVLERWDHSVRAGAPFETEVRIRRADGIYRWFHARGLPVHNSEGQILRWYNLLTDIEDRKLAEQALQASERDLAMIIETIPALVWCASAGGELTYVNEGVLNYTGTTAETLARSGWLNFVHPDDVEPTLLAWFHSVSTGDPHDVQYRMRRFDGMYRWFHVRGQVARDDEGRMTRWYGLLIDIDDRKNMEEALRSTQTRLSRASQIATIGELAASIAHEVNQPLSAIVANGHACLRWLLAEPPNLAKVQEAAERIVRDGKDAGEVVRRIRALFKRTAFEKAALDLNELIREVITLLRSEIAKRRVAVDTDLASELPTIVGDRIQLQQLVLNLILNGLEAMDAIADRPKRLFIRSSQPDAHTVLVEIRDFGIGLCDPDKAFEAFFTTKENGMGMGLAICRSIIEAHHGRIWAASAELPGATFYFALPVQSSEAAA